MSTEQQRIAELETELASLKATTSLNKALEQAALEEELNKPTILSPTLQPQLQEGQQIAFIHNRIDVVSGVITKLNHDSYDLEVYIPTTATKVVFNSQRTGFERVTSTTLVAQTRPKARLYDPRTIFKKQMVALSQVQEVDGGGTQTHVDLFIPQPTLLHIPRFHDFHTSLVGTFFDPSPYCFKVLCWRAELELDGQRFPAVTELFPRKKPFYTDFNKAFNRYFKEYHQGMSKSGSKWNRVDIQVFLKDEV